MREINNINYVELIVKKKMIVKVLSPKNRLIDRRIEKSDSKKKKLKNNK